MIRTTRRSASALLVATALAALAVPSLAVPLRAQQPVLAGVCFGPFRDGEEPGGRSPLPSALRADLDAARRVAGRIRTYGLGGTGLLIPQLCADVGLPCWPGAWIGGDRAADDLECELLEQVARRFSRVVDTVLVGNEVLLRGDLDESSLRRRIRSVRTALRDAGRETRVGTAEPWRVWLEHRDLLEDVDVVVVHVHPYWDGVAVENAARHTLERLAAVRAIAGSTEVVLGEFGWPTSGGVQGAAVPGEANAARYFRELLPALAEHRAPYFAFEMWDEAWKAGAEGAVGPHWGLFRRDGSLKPELGAALPRLAKGASERPPRRTEPDVPAPGTGAGRAPAVIDSARGGPTR
ncbi:MAG: hypothetical protein IPM29_26275 [Planctomycetes bacterium]|nr:hypothetical protein [Planctomycetota bacterium]